MHNGIKDKYLNNCLVRKIYAFHRVENKKNIQQLYDMNTCRKI